METIMSETMSRSGECTVVQASKPFVGKQGFTYAPAVSAQTVGSTGLHMQFITMPPGARAKTHKHESHETAIYVLSGESGTYYGERLEHHVIARAGDFLYMPPGVPHLPYNLSQTEPCVAVIARTDPNDQESVILLPELDTIHPA
jgi:uncharacterized RmlC-like cupin family protein